MSTPIRMPALSPTMTEGNLVRWLKQVGDKIEPGDPIAEIETDKATMELEAAEAGVLSQIVIPAGTQGVPVNEVIAMLGEEGGAGAVPSAPRAAPAAAAKPPSVPATVTAPKAPAAAAAAETDVPPGTEMVTITVREALRDAMAEEMRRDPEVFLMGEEVGEYQGAYKVSQGLLQEFGAERVRDTPITEHGFAGIGVGAAYLGLKPIVEFMTFNFAMQAIDHIINSAAKTLYMSGGQLPVPIVFRGPNGAAARVGAQHSQNYGAWYAHCPGMKVVAPFSAADAKGLLKAAIRDPNPVVVLEHEILYGRSSPVPKMDDYVVPIGRARIVRGGQHVTLVSYSMGVLRSLEAAEILAGEGIEAEVIDLRSLRPLDREAVVASVRKTNRVVAVDEGWPVCSIASEIAMIVMEEAFDHLDAPVMRVTGADVPMPYAANLEKLALPQAADVVAAAKAVCYRT